MIYLVIDLDADDPRTSHCLQLLAQLIRGVDPAAGVVDLHYAVIADGLPQARLLAPAFGNDVDSS